MQAKKFFGPLVFAGLAVSFAFAAPALAQTNDAWGNHVGGRMMMRPGIIGSVSAISGTTLTVTGKVGPQGGTATTYTVDASGATVTKNGTASSVSAIAVGDMVMVQGTVNGTSVTATAIRDGMPARPQNTPNPIIQGNGEPVVAGSVTAINGSTLTITNKSSITYTIDASNATVVVKGASSSVGSVAVGDNVVVQGTVNGTSVVAASVIDQGGTAAPRSPGLALGVHLGLFRGIGSFFKHLFGF
ncbi:MAG TPA: DUF5666 domain-containing protein [Candidatus Paceibacterota bacterium]|nr:DUF5666 domain-containing protein [Candidatus Paceibacterota bacterium]